MRIRAAVAVSFVVLAAGCGEDLPSKGEFTAKLSEISEGNVDPAVGGCVYNKLDDQAELMRKAMTTPDLSKAETDRLKVFLAECILQVERRSGPTTTSR